jgi:hypothetical protein
MAKRPIEPEATLLVDEPGMAERFRWALRKALNTPPKHRSSSKGRVHKGKTRN